MTDNLATQDLDVTSIKALIDALRAGVNDTQSRRLLRPTCYIYRPADFPGKTGKEIRGDIEKILLAEAKENAAALIAAARPRASD